MFNLNYNGQPNLAVHLIRMYVYAKADTMIMLRNPSHDLTRKTAKVAGDLCAPPPMKVEINVASR